MPSVPSYSDICLRRRLRSYIGALWLSVLIIAVAWLLAGPRVAMATVIIGFGVLLFVWTRAWIKLCSQTNPLEWHLRPEWHPQPGGDVLLAVDFHDDANAADANRPVSHIDLRRTDIRRVSVHSSYLILYLHCEPGILIVPTDGLSPDLINLLTE